MSIPNSCASTQTSTRRCPYQCPVSNNVKTTGSVLVPAGLIGAGGYLLNANTSVSRSPLSVVFSNRVNAGLGVMLAVVGVAGLYRSYRRWRDVKDHQNVFENIRNEEPSDSPVVESDMSASVVMHNIGEQQVQTHTHHYNQNL